MERNYDLIVIGLGAAGSATIYQAAKRGIKVLGIEQFNTCHPFGSSHGESRITRLAIGEGENYTPLAIRSHEIWRELEARFGIGGELLLQTGGLVIGNTTGGASFHGNADFLGTTIKAARLHNIRHMRLTASEIRKRFPPLQVTDGEEAYYEHEAGILFPEKCVRANLLAAHKLGAHITSNCKVLDIDFDNVGITLETSMGFVSAEKIVVTAGAWVSSFLPESHKKYFKPTRQTVHLFNSVVKNEMFTAGQFPVFIWINNGMYGFPDFGNGTVKIAEGNYASECDPSNVDRRISSLEITEINKKISRLIPALHGGYVGGMTCMYTVTPDEGFVLDYHPESKNVLIVSACSGHGFKHSAAVGELATQIILGEPHSHNLTSFSFERFNK